MSEIDINMIFTSEIEIVGAWDNDGRGRDFGYFFTFRGSTRPETRVLHLQTAGRCGLGSTYKVWM